MILIRIAGKQIIEWMKEARQEHHLQEVCFTGKKSQPLNWKGNVGTHLVPLLTLINQDDGIQQSCSVESFTWLCCVRFACNQKYLSRVKRIDWACAHWVKGAIYLYSWWERQKKKRNRKEMEKEDQQTSKMQGARRGLKDSGRSGNIHTRKVTRQREASHEFIFWQKETMKFSIGRSYPWVPSRINRMSLFQLVSFHDSLGPKANRADGVVSASWIEKARGTRVKIRVRLSITINGIDRLWDAKFDRIDFLRSLAKGKWL